MGASASRCRAARVPAPEPEPEGALDLSQMPPELLLVVLSHVPPRTLLGRCRQVCRGWRDLVDGQALWLLILARDRSATGRALLQLARSCQSPARNARPCPLGRFCARRPIGRNLIRNPCGQGGWEQWRGRRGGAALGSVGGVEGAGPHWDQWEESKGRGCTGTAGRRGKGGGGGHTGGGERKGRGERKGGASLGLVGDVEGAGPHWDRWEEPKGRGHAGTGSWGRG
ncbi:F-box only protein 27 [Plecturocebus cupreus]